MLINLLYRSGAGSDHSAGLNRTSCLCCDDFSFYMKRLLRANVNVSGVYGSLSASAVLWETTKEKCSWSTSCARTHSADHMLCPLSGAFHSGKKCSHSRHRFDFASSHFYFYYAEWAMRSFIIQSVSLFIPSVLFMCAYSVVPLSSQYFR